MQNDNQNQDDQFTYIRFQGSSVFWSTSIFSDFEESRFVRRRIAVEVALSRACYC